MIRMILMNFYASQISSLVTKTGREFECRVYIEMSAAKEGWET